MTQQDFDKKSLYVLSDSITKVHDMIAILSCSSVYGPLTPALERLEEALFWMCKCKDKNIEHLKELYDYEQDKKEEQVHEKT